MTSLFLACADDQPSNLPDADSASDAGQTPDSRPSSDADNTDTAVCTSISTFRLGTTESSCRLDHACENGVCIPWTQATFAADFSLQVQDSTVTVEVDETNYLPWFVDALRFDFGDGFVGWGRSLEHTYARPGVYPVTLQVRFDDFRELTLTRLAVVTPGPEHNPLHLTVNQIPAYLNGSQPAISNNLTPSPDDDFTVPFHHAVVRDRHDIDITLLEDPADPIQKSTLSLTATAGQNTLDLTDSLIAMPDGLTLRASITAQHNLPIGQLTYALQAQTRSGKLHQQQLLIEARDLPPARDPFDRPLVWLFRDELDFFTTARTPLAGTRFSIDTTPGADGQADFVAELTQLGCQGADPALNQAFYAWIKEAITADVYRIFGIGPDGTAHDDIAFKIVWSGEDDAPDPSQFSPDGTFSMMRIGGVFEGYMGYSRYAPYNEQRVDDSTLNYGVASAGVLGALTSTYGLADAFKETHLTLGHPIGAHPEDTAVFDPGFDPFDTPDSPASTRYFALKTVAKNIARALSPVIAHEMGHAMGLMPDGLPPEGFFGNRPDIHFVGPRSNGLHADLPGLNLMQAGGNSLALLEEFQAIAETERLTLLETAELLSLETRLSALSRAYLQRKLTYGSND